MRGGGGLTLEQPALNVPNNETIMRIGRYSTSRKIAPTFLVQGVQEKFVQPLPRLHRCKRPTKLSTLCECTVTPIGWYFFVQPIAAECWRGRGGKLSRILGK